MIEYVLTLRNILGITLQGQQSLLRFLSRNSASFYFRWHTGVQSLTQGFDLS
jgi:hypothetical protein